MRIGVLGGGQLGRMLALAGYPLGLQFRFLDPDPEPPAGDLAPVVRAEFDDIEALQGFSRDCAAATYEFESVPVEAAEFLAGRLPVYPPPGALRVSQERAVHPRRLSPWCSCTRGSWSRR